MLTIPWPSNSVVHPNLDRAAGWIFVLSNRERARRSLRTVQRHARLDQTAAHHSIDMARRGYFDHLDPEGRGPQDRIRLLFPELIGGVGENLALISAEHEELLARSVVSGWMNSPGHRENLLTATHTHMGIQLLQSGRQVYATQLFSGMVAELLEPGLPLHVRVGEKRLLRFRFHDESPRDDLMVLLEVPDRQAWVSAGNGRFTRGAAMLTPQWESTTDFRVIFSAQYGRGRYRICVGRASTSQYCQPGIDLNVL
jgi:hypothetical protein